MQLFGRCILCVEDFVDCLYRSDVWFMYWARHLFIFSNNEKAEETPQERKGKKDSSWYEVVQPDTKRLCAHHYLDDSGFPARLLMTIAIRLVAISLDKVAGQMPRIPVSSG